MIDDEIGRLMKAEKIDFLDAVEKLAAKKRKEGWFETQEPFQPPFTYGIDEWIVCWSPADLSEQEQKTWVPGIVLVARLGDDVYWDHRFTYVTGCCLTERHGFSLTEKVAMIFIDFHTITVRDGIHPIAAHREFLKIDQYRRRMSADIDPQTFWHAPDTAKNRGGE